MPYAPPPPPSPAAPVLGDNNMKVFKWYRTLITSQSFSNYCLLLFKERMFEIVFNGVSQNANNVSSFIPLNAAL